MPSRSRPFLSALAALAALSVQLGAAWPLPGGIDDFFRAIRAANLAPLAAGGALHHGGPRGAKVAPQWSAAIVYTAQLAGINFTDGVGNFAYDAIGQRYRNTVKSNSDLFYPNGAQLMDELSQNVTGVPNHNLTSGEGLRGVCMPIAGVYYDIFGWMAGAQQNGSKVIGGVPCTIWKGKKVVPSPMGDMATRFSACIAADGVPREFTQASLSEKGSVGFHYRFHDVRLGDPGDQAFVASHACATNYPARPCEDTGVKTISAYRVWGPPEPLELANRDTGDAMGDLSFLCTQAAGEAYRSKLITHWSVDVSSAYGQYSFCNYDGHRNRCTGHPSTLRRVGRRSSQMLGDGLAGGQCTPNADVGSQYSFPAEAQCPEGDDPSASGCAWARARPVRTVRVACVFDRGLQEACKQEFGHAPFLRSEAIFRAALSSGNLSQGGCPEAWPRSSTAIVV